MMYDIAKELYECVCLLLACAGDLPPDLIAEVGCVLARYEAWEDEKR